jgi:hypothetical protein
MPRRAGLAFLALLPALLVTSAPARAQTVSASPGQVFPERFVNGVDLGTSERPQNLTPLGINYNDCIRDMVLRFNLTVSGFDGSESLQIWATKSGDCTADTARGVGANAVTTCWIAGQGFAARVITSPLTLTFDVRVQDLVGLQNAPPSPPNYVPQGPSACTAQTTFVGVPINIYFVPVGPGNTMMGTSYKYTIATDLVGPNAPGGVKRGVGDTLFKLSWTPNVDADTNGYDVFLDPNPALGDAAPMAPMAPAGATSVLVCPEAGASPAQPPDAALEGGDDGSSLDATTSSADSGCYYESVFSSLDSAVGGYDGSISACVNNACPSTALNSAIVLEGGPVQTYDDAGNPIEGGLTTGSGGISTIPSGYLVGAPTNGVTVPDKNTGSFTITGLVNGVCYTAVVAAVDASGNVGPPSAETCDFPDIVKDFWDLYRNDGGKAGDGCALEAVGEPVPAGSGIALIAVAGAGTLVRRRRRRIRRGAS